MGRKIMRRMRNITIVAVLTTAGFGLAGCDIEMTGSPIIDSGAAQVVYQQQAGELLVTTLEQYYSYTNGIPIKLVNDSINIDFPSGSVPDSETCGNVFEDLGFDASANVRMDNTNGNSGVQTAESPHYTATWTYSSRTGLDLTFTVKTFN